MVASQAVAFEHGAVTPSDDEVRSYLHVLLSRTAFNASKRNRRFLSYVVEETLAGRADRIKAYSIALAAFDRSEDFDPLADPIVRIEAGRLRHSLEHYYLTAGRSDDIRIDIPKGSYVATFACAVRDRAAPAKTAATIGHPPVAVASAPPIVSKSRMSALLATPLSAVLLAVVIAIYGSWGDRGDATATLETGISIVVHPFERIDSEPSRALAARGLTYDVIAALTQLNGVTTFAPDPGLDSNDMALRQSGHDYRLFGAVQSDASRIHVTAILSDERTGQFLQSWSFERDFGAEGYLVAQAAIAKQLVAAIAEQCADGDAPKQLGPKEASGKRVPNDCRYHTYLAAR